MVNYIHIIIPGNIVSLGCLEFRALLTESIFLWYNPSFFFCSSLLYNGFPTWISMFFNRIK